MRGFTFATAIDSPGKTGLTPEQLFERWVSKNPEERVVTIEPENFDDPFAAAYGPQYAACLERSPRFRLARDERYPGLALRVRVWDRIDP
jgi:hypothetical protein